MKALIICSVHALCDIAEVERTACNLAFRKRGVRAILSKQDQSKLISEMTMLGFLSQLPGTAKQRQDLIDCYLDVLNDAVWSTSLEPLESLVTALRYPLGVTRPTGFLSDYPILTTNLIRSSALVTNATRLGVITSPIEPTYAQCVEKGLLETAASMDVAPCDVEVLVSHARDFAVAESLGMAPRFVDEPWAKTELVAGMQPTHGQAAFRHAS